MPLLRINAIDGELWTPGTRGIAAALGSALNQLPYGAPVIVMVHGFKYTPLTAAHSPHRRLLSTKNESARNRFMSWPRGMGFGLSDPREGLCLTFGWHGRGTIWQAYREAGEVARLLSLLLGMVRTRSNAPLHVLGHSLGARVALGAMEKLPIRGLDRIILMQGAEFRSRAEHAMNSPAGRTAEVINVTSGENDLFDAVFEKLLRPISRGDLTIGAGLLERRRNWLDLRIDDEATLSALAGLGFDVARPEKRVCHWSGYVRPGMMRLHCALLRRPETTSLMQLRQSLPARSAPRWSRLFAKEEARAALPSEGFAPM